ncbi:MAG: hypothetical protein GY820_24520 [Gammaproteobacteria bacterium]|nr:hypothetical protein [Gammaproteobacteria bacterium]
MRRPQSSRNTTEVARTNIGSGSVIFSTFADPTSGDAENVYHEFSIDPQILVSGTNLVAVEINQDEPASPDISFDLGLKALASVISAQ